MKIVNGLLDYNTRWELPNVLMFTGNKYITKAGRLVMGRGAAKQVRDSWPGVDKAIAKQLQVHERAVTFTRLGPNQFLGYFCVKDHFRESADLDLIGQSVTELVTHASNTPKVIYHLNYPGIGAGRLCESVVEPILRRLPPNVWVWK